jgi:hypothetical protein
MSDTANAETARASHTFPLAEPIKRGDASIDTLTIRKPNAGQLRGLSLQSLLSLDITSILTVVPRISMPPLTQPEADGIDPADLAEIGGAIRDFFMTRGERKLLEMMIEQHAPKI